MTISVNAALRIIEQFDTRTLRNLSAQAHAKQVLLETGEDPSNFPRFAESLDDKITFAAYSLLNAGCALAIQNLRGDSIQPLQRAASLLQYVHGPTEPSARASGFHKLIAAMAFYAAGQYSRAFVLIGTVEAQSAAGKAIALFLRKDLKGLFRQIGAILLASQLSQHEDAEVDPEGWLITRCISRALAHALEFIYSGQTDALFLASEELRDAGEVASAGVHPGWWWIVRLLELMLTDLGEASPWSVLPPLFPPETHGNVSRYIRLLAFAKIPGAELWLSQRAALPVVLATDHPGAIINLRTSAGKTRVAEIAILDALLRNPDGKVLYLAPFRSLAIEIEHTLASTFSIIGFPVSHLYGGSRVSSIDTNLAQETSIIIATPEKARALVRSAPEILPEIKLIIIDEGHLLGPEQRYVRNEIFIDHLRTFARQAHVRMLLLSAVVPNAQQIAEWVTGDSKNLATSNWKPSDERFGLLRWGGNSVRLEWHGDAPSFNPSFIVARKLEGSRRRKLFPADKTEAVAATAVRLCATGPVMVFVAKATSVPTMATAVLTALGEEAEEHNWSEREWRIFKATCDEYLELDAIEVRAATVGVLCHSARLPGEVRLAMEHLMRSYPPKVIIATTTLAQGVNVGISTVIIASPYTGMEPISHRDFWNICGRAGRAFVDGEGKILYAIDDTRERWRVKKDEQLARSYFEGIGADPVTSGVLYYLSIIKNIAAKAGIDFDLLLQMAAENDFSALGTNKGALEEFCDLLDDELLAIHIDPAINPGEGSPDSWVDSVFRESLAAIQARSGSANSISTENIVRFFEARVTSALRQVPDAGARRIIVASGLPFRTAVRAHTELSSICSIVDTYLLAGKDLTALSAALRLIEEWARSSAGSVVEAIPDISVLDLLRQPWLEGARLNVLTSLHNEAQRICSNLYGYELPWVIHAISQQIRGSDDTVRADALDEIALLVELGVPTELAARLYLSGVRSRSASTELAQILENEIPSSMSLSAIARYLSDPKVTEMLKPLVSDSTGVWIDILAFGKGPKQQAPLFPTFSLSSLAKASVLHVRSAAGRFYLCSPTCIEKFEVGSTEAFPFDLVSDDPRVVFERDGAAWSLRIRDPRLENAPSAIS